MSSNLQFIDPDDDTPPLSLTESAPEPAAKTPADLECQVCGRSITHLYKGQGAKPRYCEDHRGRQSKPSGATRGGKDARLRQDLATMMGTLGLSLMFIEPYDGLVVIDRADATVDALMEVAETNPKVRKLLEQMVTVSVWGQVSVAVAGLALPIAVHHGLLPIPGEFVEAQFLSQATRNQLANLPPRGGKQPRRPRVVPEPEHEVKLDAFGKPL